MLRLPIKPQDMVRFLVAKGYTTGTIGDRWRQYLIARSAHTDTKDKLRTKIAHGTGTVGSTVGDRMRSFFKTNNNI